MKTRGITSRLRSFIPVLFVGAGLSLFALATGCAEKTDGGAGTPGAPTPAPVAARPASVSAGERPVPGNPNPDAAANAAAFEAARKKAEGR